MDYLFIDELHQAEDDDDLWSQYRCLEELGWDEEAKQLLIDHQEEIEKLDAPEFAEPLALALEDSQRYIRLRKAEAESLSARQDLEDESVE